MFIIFGAFATRNVQATSSLDAIERSHQMKPIVIFGTNQMKRVVLGTNQIQRSSSCSQHGHHEPLNLLTQT